MRREGLMTTYSSLDSSTISTILGCPCAKCFMWGHSSYFLLRNLRWENRQDLKGSEQTGAGNWMLSILLLRDAMKQWCLFWAQPQVACPLVAHWPSTLQLELGPQTASHVSPSGGLGPTSRPNTDTISRLAVSGQSARKDLRGFTQVDGRIMRSSVGLKINEDR